jgi:hypothetical protein
VFSADNDGSILHAKRLVYSEVVMEGQTANRYVPRRTNASFHTLSDLYSEHGGQQFLSLSSPASPGKCPDNASNYATTTSFQIPSN